MWIFIEFLIGATKLLFALNVLRSCYSLFFAANHQPFIWMSIEIWMRHVLKINLMKPKTRVNLICMHTAIYTPPVFLGFVFVSLLRGFAIFRNTCLCRNNVLNYWIHMWWDLCIMVTIHYFYTQYTNIGHHSKVQHQTGKPVNNYLKYHFWSR